MREKLKMQCRDFRELADAHLDEELLVETSQGVLRHLEQCAVCRRELAARRAVSAQLRRSFAELPEHQPSPAFATRLHANLRASALVESRVRFRLPWGVLAAACLLLVSFVGWRWLRLPPKPEPTAQTEPQSVPSKTPAGYENLLAEVDEKAVGAHHDCGVEHRPPEAPISLADAAERHDAAYRNLMETLQTSLERGRYELLESHSCVWQGRRFAHIVLREHGVVVSLLVTDLKPYYNAAGPTADTVHCHSLKGYQVAYLETARYIALIISTLPEEDNKTIARNLSTALRQHLIEAEKTA
jgi:hypothetical protein